MQRCATTLPKRVGCCAAAACVAVRFTARRPCSAIGSLAAVSIIYLSRVLRSRLISSANERCSSVFALSIVSDVACIDRLAANVVRLPVTARLVSARRSFAAVFVGDENRPCLKSIHLIATALPKRAGIRDDDDGTANRNGEQRTTNERRCRGGVVRCCCLSFVVRYLFHRHHCPAQIHLGQQERIQTGKNS
jgi:hypothetical protein